jgi:hypothetical protein
VVHKKCHFWHPENEKWGIHTKKNENMNNIVGTPSINLI